MNKLQQLTHAVMKDAADLGVVAIDLLSPLQQASPGAFLPDDYHLSDKGHRAVARAIYPLVVDKSGESS